MNTKWNFLMVLALLAVLVGGSAPMNMSSPFCLRGTKSRLRQ